MTDRGKQSGVHAFGAWQERSEAVVLAASFLARARPGDTCVFFGDAECADRVARRLESAHGIRRDRFLVIPPATLFEADEPDAIVTLLALRDRLLREAREGARVRMVIIPSADTADADLRDRAEAFESMFIGRDRPADRIDALCLYDARRYPPALLELAAAAHASIETYGHSSAPPLDPDCIPIHRGERVA